MIFAIVLLITLILVTIFIATQLVVTTITSGRMKFKIQGETYLETINQFTQRNWLWEFFGVYFVGWKIQNHGIKTFLINKDRENPQADKLDPQTWVIKGQNEPEEELWEKIPRLLVIMNAELGGEEPLQVHIGLLIIFQVVDGKKFVFDYMANFIPIMNTIESNVINKFTNKIPTYEDFIAQTDEDLLKAIDLNRAGNDQCMTGVINDEIEKYGLKILDIKIPFKATDRSIENASRLKTIAEMEGDAKIMEQTKNRDAARLKAEAEKILASAPIEGMADALKGLTPEVQNAIMEITKAKAISGPDSKIQTYIERGNSTTTAITPK